MSRTNLSLMSAFIFALWFWAMIGCRHAENGNHWGTDAQVDSDADTDADPDTGSGAHDTDDSDSASDTGTDTLPVVYADLVWIRIPGGSFSMGGPGDSVTQPIHAVHLDADYFLSMTEVTADQYRACVAAGACSEPASAEDCGRDGENNWNVEGRDHYPVNCVRWDQATEFCAWMGGRLPTEAEWEYAARNTGGNLEYPWGDDAEATCELAVMSDIKGDGCGTNGSWQVCAKSDGCTALGLCDMAGNLFEWVADWFHNTYSGAPDDGSAWGDVDNGFDRTIRGGAYLSDNTKFLLTSYRTHSSPEYPRDYIGFRCAADATRK